MSMQGKCGRNCGKCPILGQCGGCFANPSSAFCLVGKCGAHGIRHVGITYPGSLRTFLTICPRGRGMAPGTSSTSVASRPQPKLELPAFLPVVSLDQKIIWSWRKLAKLIQLIKDSASKRRPTAYLGSHASASLTFLPALWKASY